MKKVMYICLAILVFGGLAVGGWFMRSGSKNPATAPVEVDTGRDYTKQTTGAVYKSLDALKHIVDFDSTVPALTKLEVAPNVVFFAPSKAAVDTFVKDTSLSLPKFLPYHVVASDTAIDVSDGKKLKTEDGQEVVIVKIGNDLYVRDAKGNDARLRKPLTTKNGKIYVIDKVLLTQ
jgi:uncharacterized surface protein with fasciclin (FAS1) repeats